MDLLTLLFRMPFMPVRALIRLAQVIQDQAERELHDPARARRQLEEADEARVSGEMSDPDLAQVEGEAVGRLIQGAPAGRTTAQGEGS